MSDKNSKAPIYIAILFAIILVAAAGYYVMSPAKNPPAGNEVTPVPTIKETPLTGTPATTIAAPTPAVSVAPVKAETIKCELCHTNPQNLVPHVNGGKLCVTCHGSQVHNIHIGPGTIGLQCDTCHGFPPKIPSVDKNGTGPGHYSVCENCHAPPPDSLKPSYGNLVVVHLSRSKYCTNCHGTDIGVIHSSVIANASNASKP